VVCHRCFYIVVVFRLLFRSDQHQNMSKMITVLVEVVIFCALIGTIATSVANVENVSGTTLVIVGLTTLFVAIGFIISIIKTMGISSMGKR
jgi:protein-S-isoprenylcysteine O-methyltransferase Ste14